jgi:hypothetical protein
MEKHTIEMIRQDLKSKRDALALAHEQLKKDNDDWNKLVITLSLLMGLFESIKMRLQWTDNLSALIPIALSSVIASVSALIKFKKFPEQMEILLQAQSLLTHTLNNARNTTEVDKNIIKEYNDSLEKVETSIYPDIRRKFLKISHQNLIAIYKQEAKFFNTIYKLNTMPESDISIDSDESPESVIVRQLNEL